MIKPSLDTMHTPSSPFITFDMVDWNHPAEFKISCYTLEGVYKPDDIAIVNSSWLSRPKDIYQ